MKALAVAVLLGGCGSGCYLEIALGSEDNQNGLVHAGDRIVFEARLHDRSFDCGGHWLVNGIEGGSADFGTIDACGAYAAPAAFEAGLYEIVVEATFPGVGEQCLECCEHAYRSMRPSR